MQYIIILLILLLVVSLGVWIVLKSRNMHIWIVTYIMQSVTKKSKDTKTKHIYVCIADHYEPYFGGADSETARARVASWVEKYKKMASVHFDSDNKKPKHSYFYPEEEYDEWVLGEIKNICNEGYGDVDIHLHHDNDTAENLEKTLNNFKQLLYDKHDLLRKDDSGNIVYGFIHGNWALDNSRPDGRWCGVDNEIDVLIQTGCKYDMTMPSAPSDTQTKAINSIYIAKEDGFAKSHNTGRDLSVGDWPDDNEILMIQGPLQLNWKRRKFGIIPRIESSELSYDSPPNAHRLDLWEKSSITIKGAEEHVFIKLHTHGLESQNMEMFFDFNGYDDLLTMLETKFREGEGYALHYVSSWEMYENIRKISGRENN